MVSNMEMSRLPRVRQSIAVRRQLPTNIKGFSPLILPKYLIYSGNNGVYGATEKPNNRGKNAREIPMHLPRVSPMQPGCMIMENLWAIALVEKRDGESNAVVRVTYADTDNDIPECVKHMTHLFGSELQDQDNYQIVIERNKSGLEGLFE